MSDNNDKPEPIISEVKRNLLGSLEVALFMREGRDRFGDTLSEAIRSFSVPILLFPLTIATVTMYPSTGIADNSANTIALLYSLRLAFIWLFFFGSVYLITKEIDRKQYFYRFITATNWLTVPSTVVFIPIAYLLLAGTHTLDELYPIMVCIILYTYAFTAFMATHVLRVPWELAGFIVFVGMAISNSTMDILHWFGDMI